MASNFDIVSFLTVQPQTLSGDGMRDVEKPSTMNADDDHFDGGSIDEKDDLESVSDYKTDSEADSLLSDSEKDLEAQLPDSNQPRALEEYTVSTRRKLTFLALYFLLNLGVTLSNKALLGQVSKTCD